MPNKSREYGSVEKRDKILHVRLTAARHRELKEASKREKRTITAIVETRLFGAKMLLNDGDSIRDRLAERTRDALLNELIVVCRAAVGFSVDFRQRHPNDYAEYPDVGRLFAIAAPVMEKINNAPE